MKKLILGVAALLCVVVCNAQNSWQGGIRFGFGDNMLLNGEMISAQSDSIPKFSPDITVGASFGWFPNRRTYYSHNLKGFRGELHYVTINQGYTGLTYIGEDQASFNSKVQLGYISLPLLFCVNPAADHGFFFEIGPQFSMLLHSKSTFSSSSRVEGVNYTRNSKDDYSLMAYQMTMNMGKIFNTGTNTALHIGVKTTYTFNNIVQVQNTRYQNFGAMLYFGFTFRGRDHYN